MSWINMKCVMCVKMIFVRQKTTEKLDFNYLRFEWWK